MILRSLACPRKNYLILGFLILLGFVILFCSGCAAGPDNVKPNRSEVLYSTHENRPNWTFGGSSSSQKNNTLYFVGMSGFAETEKKSREQARSDALRNISNHIGTYIESQQELTQTSTSSQYESFQRQVSESLISEYEPQGWYLKKVRRHTANGSEINWKAYVQLAIPEQVVSESIKKRRKQIEEQRESIFSPGTVKSIQFVARGNKAQRLNRSLQSEFTSSELKLEASGNPELPHFLVRTNLSWIDGGKVAGVMHSQKGNYEITLTVETEDDESIQLETVTGTHASVGASDQEARERVIKELVANHSSKLINSLKNPQK